MADQHILFDTDGAVGTLTLNEPERLNALHMDMVIEIARLLEEIDRRQDIRVLVLTGSGRAFSAGGDVRRMEKRFAEAPAAARDRILTFQSLILSLRQLRQPVIASVNGAAVGAGCGLTLGCDLRIASDAAKFGLPYVRLGVTPDGGGMCLLPRLVGTAKALELLLSGELIDARQAERIGLVNRVVPGAELRKATEEWAGRLAKGPPCAMGLIKSAVYRSLQADLAMGLELEALALPICLQTQDHREGVKAFLEKRDPLFKGQ